MWAASGPWATSLRPLTYTNIVLPSTAHKPFIRALMLLLYLEPLFLTALICDRHKSKVSNKKRKTTFGLR